MADYFYDSSGLVKRYANEVGTTWVQGICDPAGGNEIWVARVTGAEVVAAIWKKVREGPLSAADAITMTDDFKDHFRNQYRIVEVHSDMIEEAMNLAQQHSLRGYDAVQLASAKFADTQLKSAKLSPLIFVSADDALLAAAHTEGLMMENPNHHP